MDILYYLIPLSFFMGVVNSIAGGGGVFGVPALLALGISPVNALALNRISDLGNIAGSLKNYLNAGDFDKRLGIIAIPPILIGAFIGAHIVVGIDEGLLNKIILIAVIIGVGFLLYPFKIKENPGAPNLPLGIGALILLGLWDGAFAMAGGTFGVLIFVLLFHKSYVGGKSIMTFAAIPETLMSASILYFHSDVLASHALAMFFAATVGAFAGSKLAIKKGSQFIRYAMAVMALVIVAKLLIFDVLQITL